MKLQVKPKEEIMERALKISEMKIIDARKVFILNPSNVMALLIGIPFKPINYLGTISFNYSKIRSDFFYSLRPEGPWFRGQYLKEALRILGKKRVHVFLHRKPRDESLFTVLLLGTKEGTIAIAPRHLKPELGTERKLIEVIKRATSRFKRGIVYAGI